MKKFKALLSVTLSLIMICSLFVLPANAETALPESEHNYQNNFYGEWDYAYPNKNAEGLFVTFSDDTATEDGDYYYDFEFDYGEEVTVEDILEEGYENKMGDFISIYDGYGNLVNIYQGYELAGETVYVPGSSFKIILVTDDSITAYGFKVINVTDELPENATVYRYHLPDGSVRTKCVFDAPVWGANYLNNYWAHCAYRNQMFGNEAIIGWTLPDGEKWLYASDPYTDLILGYTHGTFDLYPITTSVQLTQYDVYGFTNSDEYFTFDGNRYYMTKEDHLHLISNICLAGGTIPLALPAAITSAVLIGYPHFEWNGSCIGFANTVCLQKKGILDVVSTQEGATCMRDLKPTKELISLLNYYNAQSAGGFLTKDKAFIPGTTEYSRQIEKLVKSALDGNIILFEFVPLGEGGIADLFVIYHGYVITGAYQLPDGGYVLLYYNENNDYYAEGNCEELYVPADFSRIYGNDYYDYSKLMFFWTDTFEEYRSFDINGNGSPFTFRAELWKHIFEVIREMFEYYILALFK